MITAQKHFKIATRFIAALALLVGMVTFLPGATASAATITLNPGDSIQDAIDAANPGDVLELTAGTYTENIEIVGIDDLTIRGVGSVTILTQGAPEGVKIESASNIVLENLTIDGESPAVPPATGIDLNSSQNVTFRNITVQNQDRNGIAVNAQYGPSYTPTENVTFENVSVINAGWAGIAFYTASTTGTEQNITGIVFSGETRIEGTQYGIQFGDEDSDPAYTVTGPGGATVDLGVVHFVNNTANVSNDNGNNPIRISADSTVDGQPISADDLPGIEFTIYEEQDNGGGEQGQDDDLDGVVPGVPNTGRR